MNIELLNHQYDLLTSEQKHVGLVGSIGVGKTFTLAHFIIDCIAKYPKIDILVAANTYTQLINATAKGIINTLDELQIPYHSALGGSRKYIQIGKSIIYLYSLDQYDNIRGIEVGALAFDEAAYSKREAIQVCWGRLRQKGMPLLARYFTSPNGFNWLYDFFVTNPDKNKKLIKASIFDNFHLEKDYIEDIISNYGGLDNPLAKQELLGEFVNLNAGSIYWAFDREKHVRPITPQPYLPVYVGQDFNVRNMCGTFSQYQNMVLQVFKENILRDSHANTHSTAESILKQLPNYQKLVIPDSTGKAVKTNSSSKSDHQILRDYGLEVVYNVNPSIRDRQNTVNTMFKKGQLFIDPSCKELIKELETLSSRDKEGEVSHLGPALGYTCWYLNPLKQLAGKSRQINW